MTVPTTPRPTLDEMERALLQVTRENRRLEKALNERDAKLAATAARLAALRTDMETVVRLDSCEVEDSFVRQDAFITASCVGARRDFAKRVLAKLPPAPRHEAAKEQP